MAGPNKPTDPGPFDPSESFFPEDLATENTATTSPDEGGYRVGDHRPPPHSAVAEPPPAQPDSPAPPLYVEEPEPSAPKAASESSGFVMEIGSSTDPEHTDDDEDEDDTSTTMMIWMGLGIIGATVGLAGAAILMLGYTSVVEAEVAVEETVAVDNVGGVKVRRSLRAPAEDDRAEPAAEENADATVPE